MRACPAVLSIALSLAGACAQDRLAGSAPDGDEIDDGGGSDPIFESPSSLILVSQIAALGEPTVVVSRVSAQFLADAGVLVETMREGRCRLLESDVSYCKDCFGGRCVGGECRLDWPEGRTAGDIRVDGLAVPVEMEGGSPFYTSTQPLPEELFERDALVTATATGDELPRFSVKARAVSRLSPRLAGECANEVRAAADGSAELTWDDPDPDARIRLWMPSKNNGHGLPPNAIVECEGPDTGALHVPGTILSRLPYEPKNGHCGVGWITECAVAVECPPYTLGRYRDGHAAAGAEPVTLRIESSAEIFVVRD